MASFMRNNYNFVRGLIIAIVLGISTLTIAQTEVITGKNISGNVRWHGIKIIRGDVTVLPSARLVITPGTKILFSANSDAQKSGNDKTKSELIVKGVLIAQGALGNKITFSSESKSPRMGDWHGIIFQKVTEQSVLDYCVIEYAYDGITIKKSKVQVSNSEIRYNYHSGLSIEVKSNPKISSNIISENDYAGIICTLGSFPVLTDNLITSNSMGVVVLSSSQPNLGRMQRGEFYNPGRNRIMQNEEYDIYNHSNKEIFAENNLWGSQRLRDVALNVFDNRDDGKYGVIDYNPLFKEEAATDAVDNLLLLAQYNQNPNEVNLPAENATDTENPETSESVQTIDPQTEIANNENTAVLDNIASLNANRRQNDSITKQSIQATKIVAESPILASSKPKASIPATESEIKKNEAVAAIDYNTIFLEAFLDAGKKEYIKKEKVKVNEILRRTMQSGIVRIQVVVSRNGRVESAKVLKGFNDVLDRAALDAANKFRYKPGTINNRPVKFRTIELFVFST
jgi:TonB family protein